MKKLILLILLIPIHSFSQDNPIIVIRKDLTVDSTYLQIVSDSEIETKVGKIPFNKIQEINFIMGYNERMKNIYEHLSNKGIIVNHKEQTFDPATWGKWSPPTYVDGYLNGTTPLSEINVQYARIVGTEVWISNKVLIEIEFGQRRSVFESALVTDKNGKALRFYSMIGALNFMHKNGYEFVTAYAFAVNNQNVYHYLLQKIDE